MRRFEELALGLLFTLAALPALAGGNYHVPAPLAGVGLPALVVGALGYFGYRIKSRSK